MASLVVSGLRDAQASGVGHPATSSAFVHLIRRFVLQCLVRPLCVVETEILAQPDHQLAHRGVAIEVHVFMLNVAPQAGGNTFCTGMKKALQPIRRSAQDLAVLKTIVTLLPDKLLQQREAQLHAKFQSLGCCHGGFEGAL